MPNRAISSEVIDILAHFDAENAPNRTLLYQVSQAPKRFLLSTLLVMAWAFLLLALSPMLVLSLHDPIAWAQKLPGAILYSFQIPAVILVSGILGRRYGTITIGLYLLAGFAGLPMFAGGGGLHYFSEISAGYILGFLFVPWTIQRILARAYRDTGWFRGRSLWMAAAAILGVFIVHLSGAVGIGIHLLTGSLSIDQAQQWLLQLSWPSLIYDVLFDWVAVASARLFRLMFWFCLY